MFVDFHTHLLPGLDDGVQGWDEALVLLRQAEADGTTQLVLTPHFWPGVYQPTPALIDQRLRDLAERVQLAGLTLQLYAGVEAYLTPDLPQLVKSGAVRPLGTTISSPSPTTEATEISPVSPSGGRAIAGGTTVGGATPPGSSPGARPLQYLLVELPAHDYPDYAEHVLFRLQTQGVIPILAHPERNSYLSEVPERSVGLAERGVLFQLNSGSLTGHFGHRTKRAAVFLLSAGLVHFLGSDAHSSHRPPLLSSASQTVAEVAGSANARLITWDNPLAALAGRPVVNPAPAAHKEALSGIAAAQAAEPRQPWWRGLLGGRRR
ncbi:MAG: hypothetical protein M1553_12915 [Firmicutes bacterium]|nr:hypothetical protein [Bacillota bacterium]